MKARRIYESPDTIALPGLEYDKNGEEIDSNEWAPHFEDSDAHPFWLEGGELVLGEAASTHPGSIRRNKSTYSGRVWALKKLISFWVYPPAAKFREIVRGLEQELEEIYGESFDILRDPEWKVEILPSDMPAWKKRPEGFYTELIPASEYAGSEARSPEELGREHVKSPMKKTKRPPYGFGSAHPGYINRRRWQMAVPLGESNVKNMKNFVAESLEELRGGIGFQRGVDPKRSMGVGIEAMVANIKDRIDWRVQEDGYDRSGVRFSPAELSAVWKEANPGEAEAVKRILDEFLSGPKFWRDSIHPYSFVDRLHETGLLWDPKYMYPTPSNAAYVKSKHPEKFDEFIEKYWKPNQIYTAGLQIEDPKMMKKGIHAGATNLGIGGVQPFIIAAEKNDFELMKLLLQKSPNDPSSESSDSKRYDLDKSNEPIRVAAREGFLEIVELLMADPRVDPSAVNNFALSWSLHNGHLDVARLLLTDSRVRAAIPSMAQTRQRLLKRHGLLGLL
jgi:hypothetical protein